MNLVDLFCGCGGFSSGGKELGFTPSLAIDVDPILTSSARLNHPNTRLEIRDIATISGADIRRELSGEVDAIIGGPPCQAFSAIGHRRVDDPRRSLLGHFYRLVGELRPKFFVMENVEGLGFVDARPVLEEGLNMLPENYDIVGPIILDAADFGAATRRRRLFVIGYDPAYVGKLTEADFDGVKQPASTVKDAIADLADAVHFGEQDGFDIWHLNRLPLPSAYALSARNRDLTFTGHKKTKHREDIVQRFASVPPGGSDVVGRHPRLHWERQCPTLRAGTGSDHGSFQAVRPIHPDEPRVITVREAARLQGFRDDFRFHPTVWHSFRMIGNSVSPIMSRAIFKLLASRLEHPESISVAAE